jgi:hypothetical protein
MEAKFCPLEKMMKKIGINRDEIFRKNRSVYPYRPSKKWGNFGRVEN